MKKTNTLNTKAWLLMCIQPETSQLKLLLAVLIVSACGLLQAQQIPVMSTYAFNRFLVNPAFTGIDNEYRAFGFFRSQWGNMPGRPVTGGATLEGSFWKDQIGTGLEFVNDKIGIFNRSMVALSYAQKIHFAKDHQIAIGVQGGAFINQIVFGDGHARDNTDPTLSDIKLNKTVFDLSVGISYKWKGLLVGFSVPNVIQPNARYATEAGTAANYQYVRHYTAFAQYRLTLLNEKFNITPTLFMRKGPGSAYQFDATLMFDYKNMFFAGAGYRNSYGVVAMAGVNVLNMFTVAYAYDYTTQPVLNGQVGATHEICFGFHLPSNFSKKKQSAAIDKLNTDLATLLKSNDSLAQKITASNTKLDSLKTTENQTEKENKALKREVDSLSNLLKQNRKEMKQKESKIESEQNKNAGPQKKYSEPKASFDAPSATAEKIKKGQGFTLDKIYFDFFKYDLLQPSIEQLDELVGFLKSKPKMHILISGYADNHGDDDLNKILSTLRAKSVADYLSSKGINNERLSYQGLGSKNPVADNNTEEGRKLNRRVEFTIISE